MTESKNAIRSAATATRRRRVGRVALAARCDEKLIEVRGQCVMLDHDLAQLYNISTRQVNQQVKRNGARFPADFVFRLTAEEWHHVRQSGGVPRTHGGRRFRPHAFTEQGAAMLASVRHGRNSAQISVEVFRSFARRRSIIEGAAAGSYDARGVAAFAAIRDAILFHETDREFITDEPFTYFLQGGVGGPIKIGSTRNLPVRLRSLRAMSPVPLQLLGVIPADIEMQCHEALAVWRIHGEWFAPSPHVLEFIREKSASAESSSQRTQADACS